MSDEEEKKNVVQKVFRMTVPDARDTMCIRCDCSGKTHAAMTLARKAANSSRAEQDRLRELKSKEMAKLKLFSQDDLDRLEDLIWENATRIHVLKETYGAAAEKIPYGYCLNGEYDRDKKCIHDDKNKCVYDCVTLVHRGLQRLLFDTETKAMENVDQQMMAFKDSGYAEEGVKIWFKDKKGNKTMGTIKPDGYLDKTLSSIVKEEMGSAVSTPGYYIFGISVMDGYHGVILVAKVETSEGDIKFNLFDQFGSFIYRMFTIYWDNNYDWYSDWYNANDLDDSFLTFVIEHGHPLRDKNGKPKSEKGVITSTLYQIKRSGQ